MKVNKPTLREEIGEPLYKIVRSYGDGILRIDSEFESLQIAKEAFKRYDRNKYYLIKVLG